MPPAGVAVPGEHRHANGAGGVAKEWRYHTCKDANGCGISKDEWNAVHQLFSERDTILSLNPHPFVQQGLAILADRYSLHLATSRLASARKATIEWIEKCNLPPHDLYFVSHKGKHLLGRFHAAVEDHYEQGALFIGTGTPCFLIRHPWNEAKTRLENLEWVKDWEQLVAHLMK